MRTPARLALAVLVALLPACGTTDWMGDPSGPGARQIAGLAWASILGLTMIVLIVWVILVFLVVRRRRGTFVDHMPYTEKSGKGWIWLWGLAVPGVLFAAALVGGIVLMYTASEHMDMKQQPDLVITGHQWWWEVQYRGEHPKDAFMTANEIHIPVGKPIVIELRSADVIHSFWIPKLHGKVDLVPARTNYIQIQADAPGRYDGQCAEFCGGEHALMRLTVIAEEPAKFEAWRFQQHEPALLPRHDPELRGAEVFEKHACGLCHTVRGTQALGTVGPDLTHLASRLMIGANSIPNDRAHLQAWIVRANSLKPQIQMPNLSQLTGEDVNALASYLRSLK